MNSIFKKLNFKNQEKIYVLNAPREFKPHLEEMSVITTIKKSPNCKQVYDFALFFVKTKSDIIKYAEKAAKKIEGDSILWFAYPKKSSKNYKSDISRNDGWQPLVNLGFEAVRMVSIDNDWSAIRLRRAEYIKSITRDNNRRLT